MKIIDIFPKNKERFTRLMAFLTDILDVCESINIHPILNGSLAVFLYTKNQNLAIDDIDLPHAEKDFPKIESALIKSGFNVQIRPWHVLQVRKDDLKVEFVDTDFWYPGVVIEHQDYLEIGKHKLRVLKLDSLTSFYEIGSKNLSLDKEMQQKFLEVKAKHELLKSINNKDS